MSIWGDIISTVRDAIPDAVGLVSLMLERHTSSADALYAAAREMGLGYTRAHVRETWKEIGTLTDYTAQMLTLPANRTVPWQWVKHTDRNISANYQHVVGIQYFAADGTPSHEKYVSVMSSKLQRLDDVYQSLEEYADIYLEPGDAGVSIAGFTAVYKAR